MSSITSEFLSGTIESVEVLNLLIGKNEGEAGLGPEKGKGGAELNSSPKLTKQIGRYSSHPV